MSENKDRSRPRSRARHQTKDKPKVVPVVDLRKVVALSAYLSKDKLEKLREQWPQYNISNGELVNEHAYLNADRELATLFSRSRCIGRVKHVGGRLQLLSPGDHSCNPIIQPSDVFRRNAPKGVVEWGPECRVQPNGKTFCSCRVENCACRFTPRSFVAVHSIYNFSKQQIAALIGTKDRRLYSYVHRFSSDKGSTPFDEATWEIDRRGGEDWVRFVVRGASAPYVHPALTWVWRSEDTCVTLPNGDDMILVWRVLLSNTLGGLIEFALTDPIRPAPPVGDQSAQTSAWDATLMSLGPGPRLVDRILAYDEPGTSALDDVRDYLSSAVSVFSSHDCDAATYARVSCSGAHVTAEMLGIRVTGRAVNLLLPIELLKYASKRCAGMQRTSASFGLLVTFVREKSREFQLGSGDPGQVIFGTAAVAFTKNVGFESELMRLLYLPFSDRAEITRGYLPGYSFPSWLSALFFGKPVTFANHSRLRNFDFDVSDHVQNWWDRHTFQVSEGWKTVGTVMTVAAGGALLSSLGIRRGKTIPGSGVDGGVNYLLRAYQRHPTGEWLQLSIDSVVGFGDKLSKLARRGLSDPKTRVVCGIAPIIEECLKRFNIWQGKGRSFSARWMLYAYEAVIVNRCDPAYFATFLMHEFAYHLPLPVGILLHVCWNVHALAAATPLGAAGIVGTNGLLIAGALLEGIGHLSITHPQTNDPRVIPGEVTVAASCHAASTGRELDVSNPANVLAETRFTGPASYFGGMSTIYKTCRWTVPDNVCQPTFGCRLVGVGLVTHAPCILRSCTCNEIVGIRQRMWADVPWRGDNFITVGKAILDHSHMLSMYRDACPLGEAGKVRSYGFGEWVKRFPSGTRKELERAKADLDQGLVPARVFDYKAFIKRERLPLSFSGKQLSTPRIIQGLGFHARVITGPWFAAYGDRVKEVMRIAPGKMLCTGMGASSETVGGWLKDALDAVPDPVILAVDQSKWDAHLHPEFLVARVHLYEALGAPKSLLEFCKGRIVANGRTMTGVRYGTVGTVHSGDGDTSAGNNVDHGMMWVRLLCRASDTLIRREAAEAGSEHESSSGPIELDEMIHACLSQKTGLATGEGNSGGMTSYKSSAVLEASRNFRVLVMGDDGVVIVSRALLGELGGQNGIRAYFRELGFNLTIGEAPVEKLEFCSGLFYPVNGTYIYGPKPGRVLAKTFWTQVSLNPSKTEQWLRGVVCGLMNDCTHVPLLGPWLHHLMPKKTSKVFEAPQEERRIRAAGHTKPDRSTVEFTMARYGLSEDEIQQAVAEATDAAVAAPSRLNSDVWARIAEVDNA